MTLESSFLDLTQKERIYVEGRLKGMSKVASATAAGYANPKAEASRIEQQSNVQEALISAMQKSAEDVGFSRKEAHDLLMSAYYSADTAAEQIAAVRELIKLHGIAAPVQVEHNHKHVHEGELTMLSNDDLMEIADMRDDLVIDGEFEVLEDRERLEALEATDGEHDSEIPEVLPDVSGGN